MDKVEKMGDDIYQSLVEIQAEEEVRLSDKGFVTDFLSQKLDKLGYRKLPKDKPPLLSDEGANSAVTDAEMSQYYGWDEVQRARQREVDIKHYEGK